MKYSIARGEAPTICPVCATISPESDEVEGVATVGGDEDERRPGSSVPFLEGFVCESGHTLADLNPTQEGKVLRGIAARRTRAGLRWDDPSHVKGACYGSQGTRMSHFFGFLHWCCGADWFPPGLNHCQ